MAEPAAPRTRRQVLAAGAATVAIAPLPAAAAAAAEVGDSVLALARRRAAVVEAYRRNSAAFDAAWDQLPEWARGGWPAVDRSLPFLRATPWADGRRVSREEVEAFNARHAADGQARLDWWDATWHGQEALQARLGLDALDAELDRHHGELRAIEGELLATPATTPAGVVEKLRVVRCWLAEVDPWVDIVALEPWEHGLEAVGIDAALRDLERMAAGGG